MTSATRWALLFAGHACVAAGVVGIFLPLLPTTPFLLLAAACYIRSSERHHRWIVEHPVFGSIIRDYQQKRAIRPRTKVVALLVLWVSLFISMYRVKLPALDAFLVCVGLVSSAFLLRVPTLRDESCP